MLATNTPIGRDENIRKALSLVIDRQGLADKVFDGFAIPTSGILSAPMFDAGALASDRQIADSLNPSTTPNDAEAKKLIAHDPLARQTIKISTVAGNETELDTETLIQEEAAQIGLKVKIVSVQPLQYADALFVAADRDQYSFVDDPTFIYIPDPLENFNGHLLTGGTFGFIKYAGEPEVAKYLSEAEATLNATARAKIEAKAVAIAQHAQALIPTVGQYNSLFLNKKVTGAIAGWGYLNYPSLAVVGASG